MRKVYKKDNKKIIFASKKFKSINCLYGIDEDMKKEVDENLNKQIDYLKSHYVNINDKKFVGFLDMCKSANIKPLQYYGEMFNKVSALQQYSKDLGFTQPVFMTITSPTWFKPLKQIRLKSNKIKMVDNPNFCGVADYVNQAREYQSLKWRKFLAHRLFKDIKNKYGERVIYMRTYEPMLDGTPHTHIVAFIPPEFKDRFVKIAKNYFSETRFDIKTDFKDDAGGVVAYILKYILKSFANAKNGKLDLVGYWYAYYRIRRFTTSRTLIPLKIFRLINSKPEFQSLYEVTKLYKNKDISISIALKNPEIYKVKDFNSLKMSDYVICEVTCYVDDEYFPGYKVIYEKSFNISIYEINKELQSHKPPKLRTKKFIEDKKIPVIIDGVRFVLIGDKLIKANPIVSKMKDYELYNYYMQLDPNNPLVDLAHFGLVKNECIKRGLIYDELVFVNDYNLDFPKVLNAS